MSFLLDSMIGHVDRFITDNIMWTKFAIDTCPNLTWVLQLWTWIWQINAHTYMYILYYYSGLISLLEYKAIKYFFFCFANYTEFNRCTWQLYYTYVIQFKKWYFFSYFTPNLCCFICHVLLLFIILGWKPSTCMLFQFVFKPILYHI